MKKINLFTIGGTIFSACLVLFVIALVFDNNQPTNHNEDWVGITWTIAFFGSFILTVIGVCVERDKPRPRKYF
jgi:hypothetical protein